MANAHSEQQALRESARDEGAPRDGSLREEMQQIKEAAQAAIREILSPNQAAVFDAAQDILPHDGKGRGRRGVRGHGMHQRGTA